MAKVNLDDHRVYKKYDPEAMRERIKELPAQCQQAWQAAMDFNLPPHYANVDKVVILGMGGSAIGGDLLRSLAQSELKIPLIVHRDYGLPAFIDGRTLVIASSYSGNTEETLSAFEAALASGYKKLVITTGGKLQELAKANNIPVFKIDYESQPRAAIGFCFLPTLCFMQKLGLISDKTGDVTEAIQLLKKLSDNLDENSPQRLNPAKRLAQKLYGRLPVIFGAGITASVAYRWKTQINENSKAWGLSDVFPELSHNAAVGFSLPKEIASRIRVVLLGSPDFTDRIKLYYDVTGELLKRAGVSYEFVDAEGKSPLAQMLSLIMLGDFVSYYLAILYKVDPTSTKAINYMKERLAQGLKSKR
jgi:glucose/mannose-6-phosphate isomerase